MAKQSDTRKRAQANADYFGVPWVCFFDTSGNYRAERFDETLTCHREGEVFYPPSVNEEQFPPKG